MEWIVIGLVMGMLLVAAILLHVVSAPSRLARARAAAELEAARDVALNPREMDIVYYAGSLHRFRGRTISGLYAVDRVHRPRVDLKPGDWSHEVISPSEWEHKVNHGHLVAKAGVESRPPVVPVDVHAMTDAQRAVERNRIAYRPPAHGLPADADDLPLPPAMRADDWDRDDRRD